MKIVIASGTASGIKRVRSELISELIAHGHTVYIITPNGIEFDYFQKLGCITFPVNVERHGINPILDFKLFIDFLVILRKIKPSAVLTFTTKPNIYCSIASRLLGIKVIMNITGLGALGIESKIQKLLIYMYKLSTGGRNVKRIFFQNRTSEEFFKSHNIGSTEVFKIIPGSGVNLKEFSVLKYPEEIEGIHFLFIARILKEKGIIEYIETAKNIRREYPNAYFHVLGGMDSDFTAVINEAWQSNAIIYHGKVDNIKDFYLISSATIHPSYYPEGMSNVILESAASGRPVITTNHPGCREGVEDSKTGFIVQPKNIEELTKAVERFIQLKREERILMGLNGRKKIEREFDRKIVTNAYIDALSSIK